MKLWRETNFLLTQIRSRDEKRGEKSFLLYCVFSSDTNNEIIDRDQTRGSIFSYPLRPIGSDGMKPNLDEGASPSLGQKMPQPFSFSLWYQSTPLQVNQGHGGRGGKDGPGKGQLTITHASQKVKV